DDEDSRMTGLGTKDPGALAANHGDDAVGDGEVHWARAENVDENAREPPAFVAGRLRIEFGGRAGRRLHVPVVENLLAIAIQAGWRNAEQVLDADGDAHLFVVFHLAQAHE